MRRDHIWNCRNGARSPALRPVSAGPERRRPRGRECEGSDLDTGQATSRDRLEVSEGESGLDEGGVGQRLRVVAEVLACLRVHLFGVQTQWAGAVQQFGEQVDGLAPAVVKCQRLHHPEGTGQEGAFGAWQSVTSWRVSVEQGALGTQLAS